MSENPPQAWGILVLHFETKDGPCQFISLRAESRIFNIQQELASRFGLSSPSAIAVNANGQRQTSDEKINPNALYCYGFDLPSFRLHFLTSCLRGAYRFPSGHSVAQIREFIADYHYHCSVEHISLTLRNSCLPDDHRFAESLDELITITTTPTNLVLVKCSFFCPGWANAHGFSIWSSVSATIGDIRSHLAKIFKCSPLILEMCDLYQKPIRLSDPVEFHSRSGLSIFVRVKTVFFDIPNKGVCPLPMIRPTVEVAINTLAQHFLPDDICAVRFLWENRRLEPFDDFMKIDSSRAKPVEIELFYEVWISVRNPPFQLQFPETCTVEGAIQHLCGIGFGVKSIVNPDRRNQTLPPSMLLKEFRRRILTVEWKIQLIGVRFKNRPFQFKQKRTFQEVADALGPPVSLFVNDFAPIPNDTLCSSIRGRVFVFSQELIPIEVTIPGVGVWRGMEISPLLTFDQLILRILRDRPDLSGVDYPVAHS
jgi:hypothetical protein